MCYYYITHTPYVRAANILKFSLSFLLLILSDILVANNFGHVFSDGDENLSYVDIQNITNNNWTSSNELGFFWYPENTILGDSLKFSLIGYLDKLLILESFNKVIYLTKENLELEKVIVLSTKNPKSKTIKIPLVKRSILLSKIPGSTLKNYGSGAGISLFSMHGGRSEEVKILFDGIDLTNSQNGLVDISEIPEQMVKLINYESNSSLNYGSGISDGIIAIKPWYQGKGFELDKGNDGSSKIFISSSFKNNKNNTSIVIGDNKESGNHPVNYDNQKVIRRNQHFNKQFLGIKNNYKLSDKIILNHSSWLINSQRGINNVVWSEDLKSFRENSLILMSTSVIKVLKNKSFKFQIQNRFSDELYFNGNSDEISEHSNKSIKYKFDYSGKINKRLITKVIIESINNSIKSTNTGNHTENILSLVLKNKLIINNAFKIDYALRVDKYPLFGKKFTQAYNIEYIKLKYLNISSSFGNSFRAPTFNDLYWQPGGNDKLKSENSKYLIYKINYNAQDFLEISTTFKRHRYQDLIVWSSNGSLWSPENINKSNRTSIDLDAHLKISKKIKLQSSFSKISSKNIELNKSLRYSPNLIGSLTVNSSFKNYSIILSSHYVGEQIIIYDYPKDKVLNSYINSNIGLIFPRIIENRIIITLSVSNLFDNEIISMHGYPEPSRSMHLNISYTH